MERCNKNGSSPSHSFQILKSVLGQNTSIMRTIRTQLQWPHSSRQIVYYKITWNIFWPNICTTTSEYACASEIGVNCCSLLLLLVVAFHPVLTWFSCIVHIDFVWQNGILSAKFSTTAQTHCIHACFGIQSRECIAIDRTNAIAFLLYFFFPFCACSILTNAIARLRIGAFKQYV